MTEILNILLLLSLAIIGYRISDKSAIKVYYWPGLGVKIIAGVALGLIYTYYYPDGDSWAMFSEASKMAGVAFTSSHEFLNIYIFSDYTSIPEYAYAIQPRAAFMTKILAILAMITHDNYWLSACYLSMFSFFGFWLAANTINRIVANKIAAVIPMLFFPSIVFWSSGVLKESVAIGALMGILAILINAYYSKRINWINILLLLIGLFLLLNLKYYYAAVLIVSFITIFTTRAILPVYSKKYIEAGSFLIIFLAILGIASISHPNFWPSRFLSVIVDNYNQFLENSSVDNLVRFNDLSPTIASFILYSPKALFAGLFYPLWMTSFNFLKLAAVLENWLLLLSFIIAVKWLKLPKLRDSRLLIWGMLMFIVTMAIFITFSTPNLGTLVRFRIGYLVVFVIMISIVITNNLNQFKRLKSV